MRTANKLHRFVFLTSGLAVVAFASLTVLSPGFSRLQVEAALCFAFIGLLSHALLYRTTSSVGGTVSFIPFLAGVVSAPSWVTVLAIAGAAGIVEIRAKRAPIKAIFNTAQFALASSIASLVFNGLGGVTPLQHPAFVVELILPLVGAFGAYLLVNKVAVSAVIGIAEGGDGWSVWRRITDTALLYDVLSLPFAYGYARVFSDLGWQWVIALSLPLLGVRQLYRTNWQLQRTSEELLQLIVNAIEARDPYTSGHSRRVAHYATIIARSISINKKVVDRIFTAAILHDVGKIHEDFAPILRKPSSLTPEERAVIESHSERGAQLVATVSQLEDIVPVVRHHHERWDGRGYPGRLAGQAIPVGSRIIMLADTIDAMTSDRPYRGALGQDVVLAELERMSGMQFDPDITQKFLASSGPVELFEAVAAYHADHPPERDVTRLFDRAKRVRIA